jgi:Ca2+-binding RTX toxin-like protein
MAKIVGTAGKDILLGTDLYDIMSGGAGDDTLDGGGGNDKMSGGDGNDAFMGGAGADAMDGGTGIDTVTYTDSAAAVRVNLGERGLGGQAEGDTYINIENVTGSQYGDVLIGTNDGNTINGGLGNDQIFGGKGNDVVIGGRGDDRLTGGLDADTFVFTTTPYGPQAGVDVITDFHVGEDVLRFNNPYSYGGVDSLDDLAFSQVGNDTVISYGYMGDSITLAGVNLDQLMSHASTDFLFV